jgi:hypothetical protein|tara:strand:- start:37 stop:2121 length:2085 start_codon:yes stop_codon:yes gene_type:complete
MNIYLIASEDHKVFGVGQTERTFEERHKDGDWAKFHNYLKARGEKLVLLGWWEDSDCLDTDIHEYLRKLPNIRKYAEWFSHKTTLDIIKNIIEEKFFPTTPEKKDTLTLAKHQKEFVAKAGKDYLEFLLFAKCRAGKSVMTLSHIVDRGHKATLVVSRYTSPMQSWKEDSKNFSNFDNLVFIDINDKDYIQQIDYWCNTDKQLILWACVQSRKTLNLPIDIDLLVYDEAHVGYNSNQWNKLREATNCPVLYVTGTAYKMVWDFADPQRYIYSYYEEQLDKKQGLNNRPSMKVILAKYESAQYQAIYGDDPDAMKNLFNIDDEGNFVEDALVQEFVSNKFAVQRQLRPGNRLLKDSTHLYITLPSVAACYAFAEYMKGTRFAPLVATGDAKVDADRINKHIGENSNGSCIITRTANVLGVTAKEVDTIINCAEGSSVEFWTQFAFRGGSGNHDWQVIDFCPQRCLESLRQTYIAACDTSPEVAEYDFVDYVAITEWNEEFSTLSAEQVNEILAADVGNAIRLVSDLVTTMNFDNLRDMDFNLNIKPVGSNVVKSITLNDNNANGKTNKVRVNTLSKSEKDEIYQKIDVVHAILERVPLVLFHAINSNEVMNNVDSVISSSHYQPVTMDEENILQMALEHNVINRESLSKRINSAYIDVQHAMNNDERETLFKLSQSTQTHQDIPLKLLDQMLTAV